MLSGVRQLMPIQKLNTLPAFFQSLCKITTSSSQFPSWAPPNKQAPKVPAVKENTDLATIKSKEIIENVNKQLSKNEEGRLFAVVHLCGKQFKVTAGDIIIVEGYWAPQNNDKIRLDKVLLVGGNDFSLIGRPLVQPGLVDVQATIIEKTLSHTRTHFKKKRRKQFMRINFQRAENTMIRINSIELNRNVNGVVHKEPEIPRIF